MNSKISDLAKKLNLNNRSWDNWRLPWRFKSPLKQRLC